METYISMRQNTVAHFIATRTILDLCMEAEQQTGARVSKCWWEQGGFYLTIVW